MPPVLVKHLMTSPVVTFFAEQTMPLADSIMRLKHFRHLPVVDDGKRLVGLVSHRDLLAHSGRGAIHDEVRVREIMTRDVWTVKPTATAAVAGATLLDHRYGCLPVVDDGGLLVGIVTERDFLRFAIKVLDAHS